MLAKNPGKQILEYVSDYVVFDVETTGVSCQYDEVVELSSIKVKDNEAVSEFTTLVNPGRPIPDRASMINGIYDDMVMDSPSFDAVLTDFIEYIGDLPLVGHNIHTFDMKFIYRDCERYFGKVPDNDYIDTLMISRMCLSKLKGHKLTDLAVYYGIPTEGAHRALSDCRMNQQIYEKLCNDKGFNSVEVIKCPRCGGFMVKRQGRYGEFLGCSNYPACRHTINL